MEQAQILTVSVIVALSLVAGAWWVLRKAYIRETENPKLKPFDDRAKRNGFLAAIRPDERRKAS